MQAITHAYQGKMTLLYCRLEYLGNTSKELIEMHSLYTFFPTITITDNELLLKAD